MKTKNNLMAVVGLMLLFVHCGGGSGSGAKPAPGVPLPKELQGIPNIQAYVFPSQNPDNRAEMTFDAASQIYRGTLILERGSKTDLTVVYYVNRGGEEIQVAHYKRPEVFVVGDSMDVNYAGDEANWQISFDLTPGTPNTLNLDGDAFSNLVEVGYGSDPKLATSVPTGPSVTATRKDPLGGDFDIGLPPPGSDLAASLTGIVEITLNADTPFDLKSFGMEIPSFGMERVTPLAEVLSTGVMTIRLHTDLLVVGGKADVELRFKAVDTFGIEKTTIIPVSIQNGPDNSPPVRLELGITDGQTLINENTIFVWELGDGSGIDDTTISAVLESKPNGVLLAYQLADENPSDARHFSQTIIFNAADYPNGEYTFLFKAKDTAGRAYSETITVTVNNADAVEQIGAKPKVKLGGQIMLGPIPEATSDGVQNVITLDGSQSLAPANATITYLWSCQADGFTFTSSKVVDSFTLRNITREEDGYAIACTFTISQGVNYKDTEIVGITVAFVNQPPVVTSLTITPKSGAIRDPDNFDINWSATDPDGAGEIVDYDLVVTRTKHDGTKQTVATCNSLTQTSLSADADLTPLCTPTPKDHGEMAKPFVLGANRDYEITLTANDLTAATGSATTSTAIQDDEIRARYRFEDNVNDASGNGRHGSHYDNTVASAATYIDSGNSVMNKVVHFDKTKKQQVRQSNQFSITSGDFTIAAWVRPTNLQQAQTILEAKSGSTGYQFYITNNGTLSLWAATCTGQSSANDLVANQNQWHHVAVTRKGGLIRYYINGELAGVDACLANLYSQGQLTIGCNSPDNGCTEPYGGDMDEVGMWNRSLAVDEVRRLCRAQDPTGTICPDSKKPIILEPAPGVSLTPTRAFWSWRGEKDAMDSVLNEEIGFKVSATKDPESDGGFVNHPVNAANISVAGDTEFYTENLINTDGLRDTYILRVEGVDTNNQPLSPIQADTRQYYVPSPATDLFLSGWWQFNNSLADFSLTGHVATWIGGGSPSYENASKLGQSLHLFQSKYFQVNDHSSLDFTTDDFFMSAYVNPVVSGQTQAIIEKRTSTSGFEFGRSGSGNAIFYSTNCGTLPVTENNFVGNNEWSHMAAVRINGRVRIYVNGLPASEAACADNISNSSKLAIGCNSGTCVEPFNGNLDEVVIDNRAYLPGALLNHACSLAGLSQLPEDIEPECLGD